MKAKTRTNDEDVDEFEDKYEGETQNRTSTPKALLSVSEPCKAFNSFHPAQILKKSYVVFAAGQ